MRIPLDTIIQWLDDRISFTNGQRENPPLGFKERSVPPLLPDISIFGKSLLEHRISPPVSCEFGDWLFAYEEGLRATQSGKDPIPYIAAALKVTENRARKMLSGYRSHPTDEMTHIARVMAISANLTYFNKKTPVDIVEYENNPVMGVDGMILSGYGNILPLRDTTNYLYRNLTERKTLSPAWTRVYRKYAVDDDSLRVLDVLLFSSKVGYEVIDRFKLDRQTSYYKPRNKGKSPFSIEMLEQVRAIVMDNDKPILTLHKMLVPKTISSSVFRASIGNKEVQTGNLRTATIARLNDWIDTQIHAVEQQLKGKQAC